MSIAPKVHNNNGGFSRHGGMVSPRGSMGVRILADRYSSRSVKADEAFRVVVTFLLREHLFTLTPLALKRHDSPYTLLITHALFPTPLFPAPLPLPNFSPLSSPSSAMVTGAEDGQRSSFRF